MDKINKKEFIQELAIKLKVRVSEAERILATHNELVMNLAGQDKRVHTGLGIFSRSYRASREGVNPRTGKRMTLPPLKVVKFLASETFKKAIK